MKAIQPWHGHSTYPLPGRRRGRPPKWLQFPNRFPAALRRPRPGSQVAPDVLSARSYYRAACRRAELPNRFLSDAGKPACDAKFRLLPQLLGPTVKHAAARIRGYLRTGTGRGRDPTAGRYGFPSIGAGQGRAIRASGPGEKTLLIERGCDPMRTGRGFFDTQWLS
jgi:hypothetical protein